MIEKRRLAAGTAILPFVPGGFYPDDLSASRPATGVIDEEPEARSLTASWPDR